MNLVNMRYLYNILPSIIVILLIDYNSDNNPVIYLLRSIMQPTIMVLSITSIVIILTVIVVTTVMIRMMIIKMKVPTMITTITSVIMIIPFSTKYTEIRLFPSEIFYQGQLVDAKQISDEISKYNQTKQIRYPNNVLCGLLGPWNLYPVTFFDLASEEERAGKSFKNESEVRYVVSMIEQLKESLISLSYSVAVITPYKAQVRRLKQALEPVVDSNDRLLSNNIDGNGSYHGNKKNGNNRNRGNDRMGGSSSVIGRNQGKKGNNEDGEINEKDDALGMPIRPFDCEVNSVDGFQVMITGVVMVMAWSYVFTQP